MSAEIPRRGAQANPRRPAWELERHLNLENLVVPGDELRATQAQQFTALSELCSKKCSKEPVHCTPCFDQGCQRRPPGRIENADVSPRARKGDSSVQTGPALCDGKRRRAGSWIRDSTRSSPTLTVRTVQQSDALTPVQFRLPKLQVDLCSPLDVCAVPISVCCI